MINKKIALLMSFCILAMAVVVSAQKNNAEYFTGEWTLDVEKSELGERSRIESMKMQVYPTVIDGKNWLTIKKTTKRVKRQKGERGIRGRMGRGRGGQVDGNNVETANYDLSGSETKSDVNRGRATGKSTAKIKMQEDGSMVIRQKTELSTRRGSLEIKNTETWKIHDNRRILIVTIERETPRGKRNSKMVFDNTTKVIKGTPAIRTNVPIKGTGNTAKVPKRISGGVINGKATSLPIPDYPAEAQASGIRGTVNVSVVVSKNGNVISAKAISGHSLLGASAVKAAKRAKFRPTTLSGQRVEVRGILIYRFK